MTWSNPVQEIFISSLLCPRNCLRCSEFVKVRHVKFPHSRNLVKKVRMNECRVRNSRCIVLSDQQSLVNSQSRESHNESSCTHPPAAADSY